MSFDILGARKAGYSDEEIAQEISKDGRFDASGALRSGYSLEEIHEEIYGGGPVGAPEAPGQEIGMAPGQTTWPRGEEVSVEALERTGATRGIEESLGGVRATAMNIPRSALETGKALGQAVIHPIETTKAVGKTLIGAIQKVIPGEQDYEQYADAFGNAMLDRYGSMENLERTIREDPVGFALDAATLLTTAGSVLRGVGAVSRVAAIGEAGKAVAKAGATIDPLSLAARGAGQVYRGARRGVEEVTGLTTGTGRTVMQEARLAKPEFIAGKKGLAPAREIVEEARAGVRDFAEKKATVYRAELKKIKGIKKDIDFKPIRETLDEAMDTHGIEKMQRMEIVRGGRARMVETYDYSRAPGISVAEEADMTKLLKLVDGWDDFTPAGLDTLKRKVDKFYSPSSESRALVAKLRGKIKDTLVKEVPGYEKMTKEYAWAADLQDDIVQALSLQDTKGADTVMRKLITGIKESNDLRRQLMDEIKGASGRDIKALIAGHMAARTIPEGLIARMGMVGAAYGTLLNPKMIGLFALASPNLMSAFLSAIGKAEKIVGKVAETGLLAAPQRQLGYQAGRIGLMPQMEQ